MTWNRPLLLAKAKALAAHISISIVLVAIALALMLLRWFPEPLFTTDGGGTGLKLLLVVDLVLGPLLTFVVFNPQKARRLMVLDLTVIALLQLGAYGAGLWSIHSVRVQAVAYHEGQFQAVTADTFADQTIEPGSWQALGNRPPYLVNVRDPKDGDEAAGISAFGFTQGLEPYHLQFLYEPFAVVAPQLLPQGLSLAALQLQQPELAKTAERWLARHSDITAESARFFRVQGFYGSAVLVLDGEGSWRGGFEGDLRKPTPATPGKPGPDKATA